MAGKFVLERSINQFVFNLKAAGNFETILTSERYTQKAGATNGIQAVRDNAAIDARYERKSSSAHQPYFVLKAGNGEVIGTSEMYSSVAARDNGIAAVNSSAPSASLDDQT